MALLHHPKWVSSLHELRLKPEPSLYAWLHMETSLTVKAQQECQHVELTLLRQSWGLPEETESQQVQSAEPLFIREIRMMCDGVAWWFARTLIPKKTFFSQADQFLDLNTKPLGSILFSSPHYKRKCCEFAVLSPKHFIFQRATQHNQHNTQHLWARRSQFTLLKEPLLLFEVFLPTMLHRLHKPSSLYSEAHS